MGYLSKSIYLVGAYKVCMPLYSFGLHHYNSYYRSQYEQVENAERFRKSYGTTAETPVEKKGWALITGGSDGIGKEYAILLAQSGFNIAVTGRSQEKLAKFKSELEEHGAALVKTFSFDASKTKDYSQITEDQDLKSNLRVIINSVGMLKASHTFDLDPQDIQNMLVANFYPMTILSKFAKNSFIQQYKQNKADQKRFAMIQLSSMAGMRFILSVGIYSSTKTYNLQFHNMVNYLNRAPGSFNTMTIDSQCVCPSMVSTPMTGFKKKHNSCLPIQTARGSLNDMGSLDVTFGSDIHAFWGCQVMCTPHWVRDLVQRKSMGQDKKAPMPWTAI